MPFCSFSKNAAMFDVTPIENMFLLEYLPTAPDGFLRVYLYARMLCLHPELGEEIQDMARALRMDEEAVFNAFSYWERQGLVERLSDRPPTYALLPLKESYAPHKSGMERDYYQYREFNASLQELFGADKLLHPQQYKLANDWINELGFTQEAILKLVSHEVSKLRSPDPYRIFKKVDKIAIEWAERGIRTGADVERAIALDAEVYAMADKVMKQFSMRRQPTVNELDCVRRWVHDWKLDEAEIIAACAETTKSRAPSIAYLDAILKSRREKGADRSHEDLKNVLRELGVPNTLPTPDQVKKYAQMLEKGFEGETIRLAAIQCARKKKNSFEELEWMIGKWHDAGVHTRDQAESYVSEMQRTTAEVRRLLEAAGLSRRPQMDDIEKYEAWKRKHSEEMIFLAAEFSRGTYAPMRYMERILADWEKDGVSTIEAARARRALPKGKPAVNAGQNHNYQQHTYTEADFDKDFFYDPSSDYGKDDAQ